MTNKQSQIKKQKRIKYLHIKSQSATADKKVQCEFYSIQFNSIQTNFICI